MTTKELLLISSLGSLAFPGVGFGGDGSEPPRLSILQSSNLQPPDLSRPFRSLGDQGGYPLGDLDPTRQQALARVHALKDEGRDISVREFLGGTIAHVVITELETGLSFEEAEEKLREILDSVVLTPERSPDFYISWAEIVLVSIVAKIYYRDPGAEHGIMVSTGLLATDGSHLFVQDRFGVSWWHRWDTMFPRARAGAAREEP